VNSANASKTLKGEIVRARQDLEAAKSLLRYADEDFEQSQRMIVYGLEMRLRALYRLARNRERRGLLGAQRHNQGHMGNI
jgi:hypothetical protein